MNQLHFTVEIHATKHKVWDTLWQDATFRQWASLIDPGTYMVGELKEGSEVQFISAENGYGVTSLVEKLTPGEYMLLRHQADTQDAGTRKRDDEWTSGTESYTLEEKNGVTTLSITLDAPPGQVKYMQSAYPKALGKVKELAEKKD